MTYAPDDDDELVEPPVVRRLRLLVMVLIIVLIVGFVAMVATIVIRLGFPDRSPVPIPVAQLVLPEGHDIVATGQGTGSVHVVLRGPDGGESLLVFDAETGEELSRTVLERR
jgi:hypothetical protein